MHSGWWWFIALFEHAPACQLPVNKTINEHLNGIYDFHYFNGILRLTLAWWRKFIMEWQAFGICCDLLLKKKEKGKKNSKISQSISKCCNGLTSEENSKWISLKEKCQQLHCILLDCMENWNRRNQLKSQIMPNCKCWMNFVNNFSVVSWLNRWICNVNATKRLR